MNCILGLLLSDLCIVILVILYNVSHRPFLQGLVLATLHVNNSFRLICILFHIDLFLDTLAKTSLLLILSVQLIFFIHLKHHISNASIILISHLAIIHVSHPYIMMLHIYVFSKFFLMLGSIFFEVKKVSFPIKCHLNILYSFNYFRFTSSVRTYSAT